MAARKDKVLKTIAGTMIVPYAAFSVGHPFIELKHDPAHLPSDIRILTDEPPPRVPTRLVQLRMPTTAAQPDALPSLMSWYRPLSEPAVAKPSFAHFIGSLAFIELP